VTTLTEQESAWIQDTARRLRLVQAEGVTRPAEQRREFLQEQISRSLQDIPAANRRRYLQALLARFPVNGQVASNGPSAPAASPATTAESAHQTPDDLLEKLLAALPGLSEERRAAFSKKIGEAGLTWVDRDALVLEVADEFRQALGLPADQQPKLTRLVQLAVLLVEFFCRLDQTALKTLGELAPRSPLLARTHDLRQAIAGFLTGTTESVEPQIRTMSALLGGFLASMLGGGRDFGRQYLERFSPTAIEDVIKGEGKVKWWVPGSPTEKELCWEKYKDLAKDFGTADLIDRKIRDCLAAFVEKKVVSGR